MTTDQEELQVPHAPQSLSLYFGGADEVAQCSKKPEIPGFLETCMLVAGCPVAESEARHHKAPFKTPPFMQKRRPLLVRKCLSRSLSAELNDPHSCVSRMLSRSEMELCQLPQIDSGDLSMRMVKSLTAAA